MNNFSPFTTYSSPSRRARVWSAVLTDKANGLAKPVRADFVGLEVPDRYVFGCGMDIYGLWRNLPAIYALNPDSIRK